MIKKAKKQNKTKTKQNKTTTTKKKEQKKKLRKKQQSWQGFTELLDFHSQYVKLSSIPFLSPPVKGQNNNWHLLKYIQGKCACIVKCFLKVLLKNNELHKK